uniref:Uncharacterized protein n=1 Tax=Eutreptiella gymnastica TaxID=73025 RepID=A0A7S4LLY4_9EUGL
MSMPILSIGWKNLFLESMQPPVKDNANACNIIYDSSSRPCVCLKLNQHLQLCLAPSDATAVDKQCITKRDTAAAMVAYTQHTCTPSNNRMIPGAAAAEP